MKPRSYTLLGPGVWEDSQGAVHFSVPDILAHFQVEDTEENRNECIKLMQDLLKEKLPDADVHICE